MIYSIVLYCNSAPLGGTVLDHFVPAKFRQNAGTMPAQSGPTRFHQGEMWEFFGWSVLHFTIVYCTVQQSTVYIMRPVHPLGGTVLDHFVPAKFRHFAGTLPAQSGPTRFHQGEMWSFLGWPELHYTIVYSTVMYWLYSYITPPALHYTNSTVVWFTL